VCEGVAGESEAELLARRLCEAIEAPLQLQGEEMYVTASLGVAVGRSDDTPDSLLRDADAAMYHAKLKGRARAELFTCDIRRKAERRRATEAALRHALDQDQLRLVYQPIVDLEAGWVVGAEALLRWTHPERGDIPPIEFIPIAEDTGLIQPIGNWVLDEACRQLRRWRTTVPDVPLFVAINISPRQLRRPFVDAIVDAARTHEVDPAKIVLEITESVLMDDVNRFREILHALHDRGLKLALDDFGVGYSSLSYLKQFPIDILKIDRAFIDGLGTEPHDSAIVAAIVGMARGLRVSLVAEGVETPGQLQALRHLGCQQAQGFLLTPPLAPADFEAMLRERRRW
jgi:EAL domain-containing protein (putative c-di-GMP-specific phosphodiesterase class I)